MIDSTKSRIFDKEDAHFTLANLKPHKYYETIHSGVIKTHLVISFRHIESHKNMIGNV